MRQKIIPITCGALLTGAVVALSLLGGCVYEAPHDAGGAAYVVLAKWVDENRSAVFIDDAPPAIKRVLDEAITEAMRTGQAGDAQIEESNVAGYGEYFKRKYRVDLGTTYQGIAHVEHENLIFELSIESVH